MAKNFQLWLDESGDFQKDNLKKNGVKNVSFIGGILLECASSQIPKDYINILDQDYHSTEDPDFSSRFNKFKQICEADNGKARFVVFRNDELWDEGNDGDNYLNLMSAGLTALLRRLKGEYGNVFLNILIAVRRDLSKEGNAVFQNERYEKKLADKMKLEGMNGLIRDDEYAIKLASAKYVMDPRSRKPGDKRNTDESKKEYLQLADIICNTFYIKNTKYKRIPEYYNYITQIYESERTLRFSHMEKWNEETLLRCLMEGRLGDAVVHACTREDAKQTEEDMKIVSKRLKDISLEDIALQYQFINPRIQHYQKSSSFQTKVLFFLENLERYFLPVLEDVESNLRNKIVFDVYFHLFTAYTHTGNVQKANEYERRCDCFIKNMETDWDMVNLYVTYKLRKIIHTINKYKYQTAIEECDNLIQQCDEMKACLRLIDPNARYENLAKVYGTLGQVYGCLIRKNAGNYQMAMQASENAINEFIYNSAKNRQYSYQVMYECEKRNFNQAVVCLKHSLELGVKCTYQDIISKCENDAYALMQYIRIMADGKACGWEDAADLFEVFEKSNLLKGLFNQKDNHPFEIIFAKLAEYYSITEETKAAMKCYDEALKRCSSDCELTMRVVGFSVIMEKLYYSMKFKMKDAGKIKKDAVRYYDQLIKDMEECEFENVFGEVDFTNENMEYYLNVSRRLAF